MHEADYRERYEQAVDRNERGVASDEDHRFLKMAENDGSADKWAGNSSERSETRTGEQPKNDETASPSRARTTANPSTKGRRGNSTAPQVTTSGPETASGTADPAGAAGQVDGDRKPRAEGVRIDGHTSPDGTAAKAS